MDRFLGLLFLVGAVGIWYFIKKKPDKKKRNISIALLAVSVVLIPFFTETEEETSEQASAANTTETSTSVEETSSSVAKSSTKETKTETSESKKETTTSSKEESSEKQASSSAEETEETSSSEEENSEAKENQEAASEEFEGLTSDGSYPYASDVNVGTKDDGDISEVELVVHADWKDFDKTEKENYIGLLKTVAAEFMDEDGSLPFMQVKSAGEIVARSEVLDSQSVKILD